MTKEQEKLQQDYQKDKIAQANWATQARAAFWAKNKRNPTQEEILAFSYQGMTGQKWLDRLAAWDKKLKDAGFVNQDGQYVVPDKPDTPDAPTDDTEPQTVDTKKVSKAYKDWKSRLEKEVKTYFNASEKTKATPSENQAVKELDKKFDSLIRQYKEKSDLNDSEYIAVVHQLKNKFENNNTFDSYVRTEYKKSLNKVPRDINDQTPYSMTNSREKELAPYVARAKAAMLNDFQRLVNSFAQTGKCPSEEQMNQWITDEITRVIADNKPENATDDDILYMKKQLEAQRPKLLDTYKAYASTVTVTNSFPGTGPESTTSGTTSSDSSVDSSQNAQTTTKQHISNGASEWARTNVSFSGCDMVISAEMSTTSGERVSAVLGSVQTFSYSIYRKLSPILNIGNINAKDYVGGPRTIAGSIVFTVFNQHWGTELIDRFSKAEGYKASRKVLMDEVAPIDFTISMANEYGVAARLALYSVRLFSEGQVMSINDIYTENTYQYVALNMDYLVNIEMGDEIDWDATQTSIEPENYVPVQQPTEGVVDANTTPQPNEPTDDETIEQIKNNDNQESTVPYDTENNAVDITKFNSKEDCLAYVEAMKQVSEDTYMANHKRARKKTIQKAFDDIQKKYDACVAAVNKLYDQQKEAES